MLDGDGAGPNMFCARTLKLAERGVKNTAGGSVGRARSGVPMDVSTPDVFCLSSNRHRKMYQNPQATERREVVVKLNAAGGSGCRHRKVV